MTSILLMEDDADLAFTIRGWLETAGHEVQWVSNATEALLELERSHFDLLVCDMYVVNEDGTSRRNDGLNLIGTLRASRFNRRFRTAAQAPVIAISGEVNKRGKPLGLMLADSTGADKTLQKPIDEQQLLDALSGLLNPSAD